MVYTDFGFNFYRLTFIYSADGKHHSAEAPYMIVYGNRYDPETLKVVRIVCAKSTEDYKALCIKAATNGLSELRRNSDIQFFPEYNSESLAIGKAVQAFENDQLMNGTSDLPIVIKV